MTFQLLRAVVFACFATSRTERNFTSCSTTVLLSSLRVLPTARMVLKEKIRVKAPKLDETEPVLLINLTKVVVDTDKLGAAAFRRVQRLCC